MKYFILIMCFAALFIAVVAIVQETIEYIKYKHFYGNERHKDKCI